MKAAVLFKANEPLQVVECELDPPKTGEVRVKMKASGVCQSDWHIMTATGRRRCRSYPAMRRRARLPKSDPASPW